MKPPPKNPENLSWQQTLKIHSTTTCSLSKSFLIVILFVSLSYLFFSPKYLYFPNPPNHQQLITTIRESHEPNISQSGISIPPKASPKPVSQSNEQCGSSLDTSKTSLDHIVFGIAGSSKLWDHRKNYVKVWWRPNQMRGFVWIDKPVKTTPEDDNLLPPIKISSDTSNFTYTHPRGDRSAIRLTRIVSETLRQGLKDVRWFVMGDDDTVFVADNLVRVLRKYDHNQYYYIGSSSESHVQNIYFSYGMAYGGGGFAISYPLAKALAEMQDRCIERYPGLYGSDDRIHACMSELGVPLTREPGFHQYDVYGNLLGLLAAHPVAPFVSIHHLDVVDPIFPNMGRVEALQRLKVPMKLDPTALMQQSICYDQNRSWTVSVSWGYAVQIYRGIFSVRDMEIPTRTFLNWYRTPDPMGFPFNTRPVNRHECQKPFVYYLTNALFKKQINETGSEYVWDRVPNPSCKWRMSDPSRITRVEIYKRPDPKQWDEARRRNCCKIMHTDKEATMGIHVGRCKKDEVIELR